MRSRSSTRETDRLAHRPHLGTQLESVAVAPDGRLVFVTDRDKPVIHVVDAETYNEVRTVRLPGVKAAKTRSFSAIGKICYGDMQGCSSARGLHARRHGASWSSPRSACR